MNHIATVYKGKYVIQSQSFNKLKIPKFQVGLRLTEIQTSACIDLLRAANKGPVLLLKS